jgi:hypothetical protein
MKPKLWQIAFSVKSTFRNQSLQDKKTVSTALLTIKALDSVKVIRALNQESFGYLELDGKTIIKVSDASSDLRHFKTAHSQYPSQLLGRQDANISKRVRNCELHLLRVNDFLESQAQFAGVMMQDLSNLGLHTRLMTSLLGRLYITFVMNGENLQVSHQSISRVKHAFQQFSKSAVAMCRTKDKIPNVLFKSMDSHELQKATEIEKQRAGHTRQMHQHAQQLFTALRFLPVHQAFQRIQTTIQRIMKEEALEDHRLHEKIEDHKRHK